uniref:Uncharacterized protein n=1 Tax=Rhizophora mucronata TaxID=61149 RepID=A0A2P2PYC9_RHIMU
MRSTEHMRYKIIRGPIIPVKLTFNSSEYKETVKDRNFDPRQR